MFSCERAVVADFPVFLRMEKHDLQDGEWIAVQVRCGFEQTVSEGLQQRGYEQFLPSYKERRFRGSQIENTQRPLFPGYVFCRYIRVPRHRIVATPAVIRLVGAGSVPISIPDIEIDAIRRVVDSGLHSEPWKFLQVGQAVVVNRGALCGVRGILVSVRRGMRLLVSAGERLNTVGEMVDHLLTLIAKRRETSHERSECKPDRAQPSINARIEAVTTDQQWWRCRQFELKSSPSRTDSRLDLCLDPARRKCGIFWHETSTTR